jgi:hypothetical protein
MGCIFQSRRNYRQPASVPASSFSSFQKAKPQNAGTEAGCYGLSAYLRGKATISQEKGLG